MSGAGGNAGGSSGGAGTAGSSDLDAGDGGDGADAATCGGFGFPASCAACLETSCCDEAAKCANDVPCQRLFQCVAACAVDDVACFAACRVAHPTKANDAVATLSACRAAKCGAACGVGCGVDLSTFFPPDESAACATCIIGSCCDSASACANDVACQDIALCYTTCRSPDCDQTCFASWDASVPLWNAATTCYNGSCAATCKAGTNWTCVGTVDWPIATAPSTHMRVVPFDILSFERPTTLAIQACGQNDKTCATSLGTATHEDPDAGFPNGDYAIDVTIPPGSRGFQGYLEITDPSGVYMPTLWFFTPPATGPETVTAPFVMKASDYQMLAKNVGVTPDPSAGVVLVQSFDCFGFSAAGVTGAMSPAAISALYTVNGFPNASATHTDSTGRIGFVNVPALEFETITVTPPAATTPASTFTIFTRANALSGVQPWPTP